MNLTSIQLDSLLGRKVCFNTICDIGEQQITGILIGFTIHHNKNPDLLIDCDKFGFENFNSQDIHDLIYSWIRLVILRIM